MDIEYECVSCGGTGLMDEKKHKDPRYYFECDCGELMKPKCEVDEKTRNTASTDDIN